MVEIANTVRERLLRVYLPVGQVLVALVFSFWGSAQTTNFVGNSFTLDYIAPAEYVLHVVNMPAALLVHAISRNVIFHIGPEYSTLDFVVYLCLIGLLWFVVGSRFARPRTSFRSRNAMSKLLSVGGIFVGIAVAVAGVSMLHGPWALFLPFAAVMWGVGLISVSI